MKILIEKYEYSKECIDKYLPGLNPPEHGSNHMCSFDNVGYYFDTEINDCLFFLPKVLLTDDGKDEDEDDEIEEEEVVKKENGNLLLGKYRPEDIIDIDNPVPGVNVNDGDRDFIHNFAIWIYRTMAVYRSKNEKETSIKNKNIAQLDNSGVAISGSNLDNVLALIKYHKENKDFLLFSIQDIKRGYNKINWNKTISHRTAIRQKNGSFLYMNPVNKKKQVNYEEELVIIYYSILNYISKVMGFDIHLNMNFELIPVDVFRNTYMGGLGKSKLLQIKYKYFSDKSLKLWNLCYHFFDRSAEMYSSTKYEEYLMSTSFESIFEAIIDELIGSQQVARDLKKHKDGKIVDHIYPYSSLINGEQNIYYIGDSKYYKIGHEVVNTALYKQYTYAKNVIQYNLNLFLAGETRPKKGMLPYRDLMTEGYNVTPNFFISAKIAKNESEIFDYDNPYLEEHTASDDDSSTPLSHVQKQFENRLFDRDTLWLSQYDINFLFIIAMYVRNNDYAKESFKEDARRLFRRKIIPIIEDEYDFFLLRKIGNEPLFEVVQRNFRWLNGKVYHPYKSCLNKNGTVESDNDQILIFALENDKKYAEENLYTMRMISKDFEIYPNFKLEKSIERFFFDFNNKPWVYSEDKPRDSSSISQPKVKVPVMKIETGINNSTSIHLDASSKLMIETSSAFVAPERISAPEPVPVKSAVMTAEKFYDEDIEETDKYVLYLPQYDIRVACGTLEDEGIQSLNGSNASITCWRNVSNAGIKINRNMFIIEAKGESMLPEIQPGDLCIFEIYGKDFAGSRDGYKILATSPSRDVDYLCSYTIKVYHSEKVYHEDGTWEHTKIELTPLNKEYDTIIIKPEDTEFRIFAVYKGKL